jgi:hypothetical protein
MNNPKPSSVIEMVNKTIEDTIYGLNVNEQITQAEARFIVSAALRTITEELQCYIFLPGNDMRVVYSKELFTLVNQLEQ